MKFKRVAQIFVGVIIIVSLLMAVTGFSGKSIDLVINWLLPVGVSFIISALLGEWLEELTGDFFKDKYLSIILWEFRLNIPLFVVLVIVIKFLLFRI